MKLSLTFATASFLAVAGFAIRGSLAFAPRKGTAVPAAPPTTTTTTTTTTLGLFGGGAKKIGEGDKNNMMAGPAAKMAQMAAFKKAAEVAQMKIKVDQELSKESFEGSAAGGKVVAVAKFVPSMNPMEPMTYDIVSLEFKDDEWYAGASPDDLGKAAKEAIDDATSKTLSGVEERYKVLAEAFQSSMGGPPPA
jgi:hypothetical protein